MKLDTFKFRLLSLLIVFGLGNYNTDAQAPSKSKPSIGQLDNALLWEISGNGLTKPSYLFGTIHIINGADYFLPKETLTSIDKSEKMYFEIDMAGMSDMSTIMGMMDKLFMNDDKTLKDLLSAEDYELVTEYFSDMGLPIFFLQRIKPLLLSALANKDMNPMAMNDGSMKSYEIELNKIAEAKGMPTAGIETIEFQVGIFDKIPYEKQAEMLMSAVKAEDEATGQMDDMIKLYKEQNISGLYKLIQGDKDGLMDFEDELLINRNTAWIPIIEREAKIQPTFIAVGAGHLPGSKGVINLLKEKGYTVKALSAASVKK
jgi:hypothetical protein